MKKRILSALLLCAMLTSLAACSKDGDDKETKGPDATTEAPVTNPAGIAPANYDEDFVIYAPDFGMYQRYFFADDAGTDVMTKSIYERELAVEDHLGVRIGYTMQGGISDVATAVQQLGMTGDDTYQLVLTHCISGLSKMISENLLFDFNDFEYIDMEAEWWNQQAFEALEVGGHRFYGVSDYMLSDPNCVLVNLDMLEELNIEEDPYQLVRDGKWTIDNMMAMMSKATKDNGDGKWDHMDTYGLTTSDDWFCNSFTFSSEIDLVGRNDAGEYVFAFDSPRAYDVVEKVDQLLSSPDTHVYVNHWDKTEPERLVLDEYVDISKGRSLFNIYNIASLYLFRDVETNFGVLPYPKYEESQDGYYTNDWSGLMCVPKNVGNPEMVGKVIELLSFYSEDVRYAYYEVMLGEKLTRDPASVEMLNIIFDGVSYNAGVNYFGFGGMNKVFFWPHHLIMYGSGSGSFSSFLATYKTQSEAEIATFNAAVAAIDTVE